MPSPLSSRSTNRFQVGVIGTGWIANLSHGPALREFARTHPQICLRAVSDVQSERAAKFASQFGFERSYADTAEMLAKEHLQAVYVLVPDRLMARVASLPLSLGIPTLIEKPPGKSPEEVYQLMESASKMETPHFVAFNRRCVPLLVALRQRVQAVQEETGAAPELISYLFSRHGRFDADFSTTAIHPIDTVSFLGQSPYEFVRMDYHKDAAGEGRGENIFLHGQLQSGTRTSIEITPDAGLNCERVNVHFPSRTLSVAVPCVKGTDGAGYLREYLQGRQISEMLGEEVEANRADGFYDETEQFLTGLLNGQSQFPGHELTSAVQSVGIMHAIENRQMIYRDPVHAMDLDYQPSH